MSEAAITREETSPSATREKFLVVPVLVLMLAQIGTVSENTCMGISASALISALGATMADVQLANMIYPLIAGAAMVAGGMLGIIIGWKKNLRIGLMLAALGEFAAMVAPNMTLFIWVGRVLVGTGASLLVPSLLGIIPTIYKTGKDRAIAFGCIGAAMGIANAATLILGAAMDAFGFRVSFGLLGVYFLLVFAASFAIPAGEQLGGRLKFDFVGTVISIVGLFLFLFGVSRTSVWGLWEASSEAPFSIGGISPAPLMIAIGLILIIVLFQVEKKVEDKNGCALIPRSFYKTPQVLAGLIVCAAIFVFNGAMTILMLPYGQLVGHWSALLTGVAAIAYGLPMFFVALLQPRLLPQATPRSIVRAGYVATAIGAVLIALSLQPDGLSPLVWIGVIVAGMGSGALSAQASNVVALAVNDRDASQSGGVQATCRNVGQAVAIAVLGAMLLFGISGNVVDNARASETLSDNAKTVIAQHSFSMTSDDALVDSLAMTDLSTEEIDEVVSINATARMDNTRLGLYITAGVLLLALFSTRMITIQRKE